MPKPKGHIAVIAAKYGITPKYVRDIVKRNPDLGITLIAREPTILNQNEINALCAAIEKDMEKYQAPTIETNANYSEKELKPSSVANETEFQKKIEQLNAEIESLKSELASTKTDLAIAQTQADERNKRINDLKETAGQQQKLLEAARDERDAAQEEAGSYRKSIFGFYRRKK